MKNNTFNPNYIEPVYAVLQREHQAQKRNIDRMLGIDERMEKMF